MNAVVVAIIVVFIIIAFVIAFCSFRGSFNDLCYRQSTPTDHSDPTFFFEKIFIKEEKEKKDPIRVAIHHL